jgi:hypothetical protein
MQTPAVGEHGSMSKSSSIMKGLLIPAFFLAGAIAQPAVAQEKKAEKAFVRAHHSVKHATFP